MEVLFGAGYLSSCFIYLIKIYSWLPCLIAAESLFQLMKNRAKYFFLALIGVTDTMRPFRQGKHFIAPMAFQDLGGGISWARIFSGCVAARRMNEQKSGGMMKLDLKMRFRSRSGLRLRAATADILESRRLLSTTYFVTNPNAAGTGSLAAAITANNSTTGGNTIDFSIPSATYGAAPYTINIPSAAPDLPTINEPVTINGTTQSGYGSGGNDDPVIQIKGPGTSIAGIGLNINASNSTIYGLAVGNFYVGIELGATTSINADTVEGCFVGTDPTGMVDDANVQGIIASNCSSSVFGGLAPYLTNVISGNRAIGILLTGSGAGNVLLNNLIGLNAAGTGDFSGNSGADGIDLEQSHTTIGGTNAIDGNYISGNSGDGIHILQGYEAPATTSDYVEGNSIGLPVSGTSAVGNGTGVELDGSGVNHVYVGYPQGRNVISGNQVGVYDVGDEQNFVENNLIGTNNSGTAKVPNLVGVELANAGSDAIGEPQLPNIISGNTTMGVELLADAGLSCSGNVMDDNFIGTEADGVTPLGNGTDGIYINGVGTNASNTIGANTIADNGTVGVMIAATGSPFNATATGNRITENDIFGNGTAGIELGNSEPYPNTPGDAGSGPNNLENYPVITQAGVTGSSSLYIAGTFTGAASTDYTLEFFTSPAVDSTGYGQAATYLNFITVQTNSAGTAPFSGFFSSTATAGQIVTATATDPNGNTSQFAQDVTIGTAASLTTVTNVNDSGTGSLRNALTLANTTETTVSFNIPTSQSSGGIFTITPASPLPGINQEFSVDGSTEAAFLGQTYSAPLIYINGANQATGSGLSVGSDGRGAIDDLAFGNFNQSGEAALSLGSEYFSTIYGDYIGVDPSGDTAAYNTLGISVDGDFLDGVSIGGAGVQRNVISGNNIGISVISSDGPTTISGNYIGVNPAGTAALSNDDYGIDLTPGAPAVQIGSNTSGGANVISGNKTFGIFVEQSKKNVIEGNYIGVNAAGTAAIPNGNGICDQTGTYGDTIGGATASARNIISGNTEFGVEVDEDTGPGSSFEIENNYIGTNAAGTAAVPNGADGINAFARIGTISNNVISGNGEVGIDLLDESSPGATVNILSNYIGTNAAGSAVVGNNLAGIYDTEAGDNIGVGGGNVIAGNGIPGSSVSLVAQIYLASTATGTTIQDNLIGTNALDNAVIPENNYYGIAVNSTGNTIGGNGTAYANTIAGSLTGINLNASGNLISSNYIGTNAAGATGFGNLNNGIQVNSSSNQIGLGSNASGQANIIADNGQFGIVVINNSSVHNTFRGNSVYGNGSAQLDFGNSSPPTGNHASSPTTGPNDYQNYPILTVATIGSGGETLITGTLTSVAGSTFYLDFYDSPSKDANNNGQGVNYLGYLQIIGGLGVTVYNFDPQLAATVPFGYYVTATATCESGSTSGDTSEFSNALQVAPLAGSTYYLRVNPSNSAQTQIYNSSSASGSPQYMLTTAQLTALNFTSLTSLTIYEGNGNPLGSASVSAAGTAASFIVDSAVTSTINSSQLNLGGNLITYSGFSTITFNGGTSGFALIQNAQPSAGVNYNLGGGTDILTVNAGTFAFPSSDSLGSNLELQVGQSGSAIAASVTFGPASAGRTAPFPIYLQSLGILGDGNVTLNSRTNAGLYDYNTLDAGTLTFYGPTGYTPTLNLNNNDMVLQASGNSLSAINNDLSTGFNAGQWNGTGIDSGSAAGDATHLTALGMMPEIASTYVDGVTFATSTATYLVKYTYYGDANLSGNVDGSDYSLIDNGYLTQASGWNNGDFNYDGTVNGSDYTLIDNAYNRQASVIGYSYRTLASFTGNNGQYLYAGLTLSSNGSTLYGTTYTNGPQSPGGGTVFSEPVAGGAPTTLASFVYNNANGSFGSTASLVLSGSTLYGTSQGNPVSTGMTNNGAIFSVSTIGGNPNVLASFNTSNGANPNGRVLISNGFLYGTTLNGGTNGDGTVFSMNLSNDKLTTLWTFSSTTGANPFSGLILAGTTLYGTTENGGLFSDGTVFSLPITGDSLNTLAAFNGSDGSAPLGDLILSGSTLYGTTSAGGPGGQGTVFSVPASGGVPSTLASFNGSNGGDLGAGLLLSNGILFGSTYGTGAGLGSVFSVPITGGTPTTLHTFTGPPGDGANPICDLIADSNGNLYGTTVGGGTNDYGTIFELSPVA